MAVHVSHHRHAARIVLERGVVQPLNAGRHSHLTLREAFMAAISGGISRLGGGGAFVQH
jgi:hypothetical protein